MAAAYLTYADLVAVAGDAQLLRWLDDDNDGAVDAAPLADVLQRAEVFVRGHVGRLYPMATVLLDGAMLAHLRSLAAPVAAHYASQRRPEFTTREGSAVQGLYNEAVKMLDKIRKGEFQLDTNGTPVAPANTGGGPRYGTVGNLMPYSSFAKKGSGLF